MNTFPIEQLQSLIDSALAARQMAYARYSNYQVGAALLTTSGKIYTGCNVENASYPASICAERTALVKAISEGEQAFSVIVVATRNGGSPCGICRQMLYEFAPDMQVITIDEDGRILLETTLRELLHEGFGPTSLVPPPA